MTWEQKLQAMQSLVGFHAVELRMRKPGDWYVSVSGRHIRRVGGCTETHAYGNGPTPEAAVENDWLTCTEIPDDHYIVVDRGGANRKFRWNGFMWESLGEEVLA